MTADHHTRTEADAAISARQDAYPDVQDERDEPGTHAADHDCAEIPCPEDCWGCAAFVRAAELAERDADPVWREHVAEQNREWWAS